MNYLLSTAYWPNLYYFSCVLNSENIMIEQFENYQKQSFRNRCTILSANGPLDLIIPVQNNGNKQLTKDVLISYKENWQIKHWRAITSAYRNSPYFEHFEPEIHFFYEQKFEFLLEYNVEQLKLLLKLLRVSKSINLSNSYETLPEHSLDLRTSIHPKLDFSDSDNLIQKLRKPYYQVFVDKFGFTPNLSILDLFFNTGLGTVDYLSGK
ncbi:MAG: WbqC family protein [Bacteroidia bacterium]|nr:WbqC family protein [Bacteroidia bacterium]